ncbi:MAG TPA: DNA-processing protein DprA [Thermoanaerobaculia bacterium]|nr:DNA-processing protein DprA [Thermoanaerobaculia bacterium]
MTDVSPRDLCIAYARLPFLTPARIRLLREHFETLPNAQAAPPALLQGLLSIDAAQAEQVKNPLRSELERTAVAALRSSAVTLEDPEYPRLLRETVDPPPALFYRGGLALLDRPLLAMVGSRRASPYGMNAAAHLARQLVSAGIAIVSGLARGIDAASHLAALDAGGATIAVLGTGIDVVYPRSHGRLHESIAERGLILTEFPHGTPPLAGNFPVRNRIISGMTLGTVIVEATGRSGSLITARLAAEQGREVFAVPGSIFAAGSEGPHRLAQYGAKLVHDANDILEELPGGLRLQQAGAAVEPESPLREVLAAFTREEAMHIDAIATKLGQTVAGVSEAVLQLELGGWLKALPGARYTRVR